MRSFSLYLRMMVLLALFFGIVYGIITIFMQAIGIGNLYFYFILALLILGFQYMIGPKIVEMSMRVRYIRKKDLPWLYEMVEDLARKAKIPQPRVGIAEIGIPNAFAFGRTLADGRVCVTRGILNLLDKDELKAVLGHEITHLKNRDVLFITLLSALPLILYWIALRFLFFGSYGRRREGGAYTILIGLVAFIVYFITNLLILYASRIREYFADRGSVMLGNPPYKLATALYKLVYGSARIPKESLKEIEGLKAFFLNDLSKAHQEIYELSQLDIDRSGTIDPEELDILRKKKVKLSFADKMMEILSTHPNMLKRIKHLSSYH